MNSFFKLCTEDKGNDQNTNSKHVNVTRVNETVSETAGATASRSNTSTITERKNELVNATTTKIVNEMGNASTNMN